MTNQSKKKDYKVGYKKTPEDTRFKKGQSGNPSGRPKGSKSWPTLLEEVGRERITIVERGKPKRISKKRALVKRAYHLALVKDDLAFLTALGAFNEVKETREYPLTFTLKLEDDSSPANDASDDDDFDYSQPQLKPGGSKAPG